MSKFAGFTAAVSYVTKRIKSEKKAQAQAMRKALQPSGASGSGDKKDQSPPELSPELKRVLDVASTVVVGFGASDVALKVASALKNPDAVYGKVMNQYLGEEPVLKEVKKARAQLNVVINVQKKTAFSQPISEEDFIVKMEDEGDKSGSDSNGGSDEE